MPKRTDLKSILLIGSGPIIIGQGAEFDYSGTQAVRALKEEGYRVILVNSNPATIMTDPELADATYIEPVTPEWVAKVIERERPDALLPTMGGQTALNVAMALVKDGTLVERMRFHFPRQEGRERLCIADYFRGASSGDVDVVGFQVVTVGDEDRQPVDGVEGDLVEGLGGVSVSEVARPTAQETVEVPDDVLDW